MAVRLTTLKFMSASPNDLANRRYIANIYNTAKRDGPTNGESVKPAVGRKPHPDRGGNSREANDALDGLGDFGRRCTGGDDGPGDRSVAPLHQPSLGFRFRGARRAQSGEGNLS